MGSKQIFYSKFLILPGIFLCFQSFILAQIPNETENPRVKNFGWSLKQNPDNSGNKSETAKEVNSGSDDDVIKVETNLVVNDILVLDNLGRSIKDLKKEDFIVVEDGQPQSIETFSLGDESNIPRSIVLIIDYSGSQFPYIKTSIDAAKVLVDKLKPKDKMAIVTDDVELLTDFTHDKNLLKEKLEALKNKALSMKVGRSEQFSALYAVLNEIFKEEDVRPIIIFQTDGDELFALQGGGLFAGVNNQKNSIPGDFKERNFSFDNILTATEKARATIYTIYPGLRLTGVSENEQLQRTRKEFEARIQSNIQSGALPPNQKIPKLEDKFLKRIAESTVKRQMLLAGLAKHTGGWADFLETPEQSDEVYTHILSGINSRYIIGYYPTNEEKDGKRRTVKIEVKNHPEYIIWGRKTYFAPVRKSLN